MSYTEPAHRSEPWQPADACNMWPWKTRKCLRGAKLLHGQRGVPAANVDQLAEVIARIGDVLLGCGDDLQEADINPLWVRGDQVEALDGLLVWRAPPAHN